MTFTGDAADVASTLPTREPGSPDWCPTCRLRYNASLRKQRKNRKKELKVMEKASLEEEVKTRSVGQAMVSSSGSSSRRMVTTALLLAMMVTAAEQLVVSPAMTTIITQLKGFELFPWVVSAYLLAATVSTPIYGKLADLFGRKPVLLFGLGLFSVGSVLSGAR